MTNELKETIKNFLVDYDNTSSDFTSMSDYDLWLETAIGLLEQVVEIERLRLTRGERRALEFAVGVYPLDDSIPDTLRGLLERTKTV